MAGRLRDSASAWRTVIGPTKRLSSFDGCQRGLSSGASLISVPGEMPRSSAAE